eukprot:CAMPEP_0113519294 /NCGR_PEP_ID=MMETSP0014_2-20120614/43443_1 /TAXON_ID=2857 /ORGANISM="Nitzschia sp." /LENGTH=230 /DNA_ID=CAMNT_0000417003 /DNA_START=82 /DNA_END=774 /DNA_ORIENTATION=- /assembly_acc=CAM_ASM_000159
MMKSFAALCLFLGSTSAFAPSASTNQPSSVGLNAAVDDAFGVSVETGNKVPALGRAILKDAGPDAVKWFQNAEIKHGRIAMVATVGRPSAHWRLYAIHSNQPATRKIWNPDSGDAWLLSSTTGTTFSDIAHAAPFDAVGMVPAQGWFQIFLVAGWFECIAYNRQWAEGREVPGDYGYDPLGFTKRPGGIAGKDMESLRMKEIKNGRVAMMTIAAWVSNEALPGALPVWHP